MGRFREDAASADGPRHRPGPQGEGGGPPLTDGRTEAGRIGGRPVYQGRVIDVHLDHVRFPDGSEGELEIVRHPGAAAVLPVFRPGEWEGTGYGVLLLRQYRYAADGSIWEVPAGKLEGGEPAEVCARRELEEEAGLRTGELRHLTRIHTTPGFIDERIDLFLAFDLQAGTTDHEASEFIERRRIGWARALHLANSGAISDGKTLCTLLFAAAFEPELRSAAVAGE